MSLKPDRAEIGVLRNPICVCDSSEHLRGTFHSPGDPHIVTISSEVLALASD